MFRVFRYEPAQLAEIARFMRALVWSLPPLLVYSALRRFLQATSRVGPVVFALVTANLVNVIGNWILIYGHLGAPAMGTAGSAWSAVAARSYMAAILEAHVLFQDRPWHISLVPDLVRIRELLRLGLPAASQITMEIGVFATAGALIGKLGDVPLAAHQIAIQTISATYMVPLGISSAAAVRWSWWRCRALSGGVYHGRRRGGGGSHAAGCGGRVAAFRRATNLRDGSAARSGRHTHCDAMPPHRLLGGWASGGLCAVLQLQTGRRGDVVRAVRRGDPARDGSAVGMVAKSEEHARSGELCEQ